MNHRALFLRIALLCTVLPTCASAQINIVAPPPSSFRGAPLFNNAAYSGYQTYAYAETFHTPDASNTRLDQFQLFVASNGSPPSANFTAYVAQWNNATYHPATTPLWTSALQSAVSLPGYGNSWATMTFDTGGLVLSAGQTYALVLLAERINGSTPSTVVAYTMMDTYAGGSYNLLPGSAPTYADIATLAGGNYPTLDLAFSATFSASGALAVPEPAVPAAAFALALCLGLFVLRRRQLRTGGIQAPAATE